MADALPDDLDVTMETAEEQRAASEQRRGEQQQRPGGQLHSGGQSQQQLQHSQAGAGQQQ